MKLNLGCGQNKFDGFVNVDKAPECDPDRAVDLERIPVTVGGKAYEGEFLYSTIPTRSGAILMMTRCSPGSP